MNIAIVCIDTRGGIQPYIALGLGLKAAGHNTRLLAPSNYRDFVERHGLAFHGLEGDIEAILRQKENLGVTEKGFWAPHLLLIRMLKQCVASWTRDSLAGCEGVDLILGGVGGMYVGTGVAEKLNVPFLQAHLQPLTTTRRFPGIVTPFLWGVNSGTLNYLSHYCARQLFWQPFRSAIAAARRDVLGLRSPVSFWSGMGVPRHADDLILYGYSQYVLPRPPDWPRAARVTGYWFLDAPNWLPSQELTRFLENGEKPVLVGFGSMGSRDAAGTANIIVEALKRAKVRGILVSGWGGIAQDALPDTILRLDSAPYDWLFPKVAAVVHHGGAGTTGLALRCGVPSIVVPFTAEQPFWGQLVARSGFGPAPIPRKRLTTERLAAAIAQTIGNADTLSRVACVGKKIRAENGIKNAVEIIERYLADKTRI